MSLIQIFARNVRALRLEKGWTQERLAFEAEVKRAYISEIESAKRNPSLDVVERLAKALEIGAGQLLADEARDSFFRN